MKYVLITIRGIGLTERNREIEDVQNEKIDPPR